MGKVRLVSPSDSGTDMHQKRHPSSFNPDPDFHGLPDVGTELRKVSDVHPYTGIYTCNPLTEEPRGNNHKKKK